MIFNMSGGGSSEKVPTFTLGAGNPPTVTCNMTFNECEDYLMNTGEGGMCDAGGYQYPVDVLSYDGSTIVYVSSQEGIQQFDITYSSGGNLTFSYPSSIIDTLTVTQNGTYTAPTGKLYDTVDVTVSGGSPVLQTKTKTYTPTESQQTDQITADAGYDGLQEVDVTVNAISSTYVGSGITRNTSAQVMVDPLDGSVAVPAGYYENAVNKTMPSAVVSSSSVSIDSNGDASGAITVGSGGWIGAGNYPFTDSGVVTPRDSSDLVVSGATVTVPAGYYPSGASTAISSGSATTPATTITSNPTISVSSGGLITASNSKTQSVTPTVSAGYVSSGTAGTITVSGSNTSQLTVQAAQTIHPSTSDQTISSGKYLTGTQTFKAVTTTNLLASIIKAGEVIEIGDADDSDRIASVTGTYQAGGSGPTLLTTVDLGTISTSSTSATDTGKTVSVSTSQYDLLIVLCSVKTKTNNRHIGTAQTIWLQAGSSYPTKSTATIATATWNAKLSSNGTGTTRANTTKYGIYVNSATIGSGINPQLTMAIYQRYNSTQTGTINGNYECRVYGVNLYNLIGA